MTNKGICKENNPHWGDTGTKCAKERDDHNFYCRKEEPAQSLRSKFHRAFLEVPIIAQPFCMALGESTSGMAKCEQQDRTVDRSVSGPHDPAAKTLHTQSRFLAIRSSKAVQSGGEGPQRARRTRWPVGTLHPTIISMRAFSLQETASL